MTSKVVIKKYISLIRHKFPKGPAFRKCQCAQVKKQADPMKESVFVCAYNVSGFCLEGLKRREET